MSDVEDTLTDLNSHHIEGWVGYDRVDIPLITHIEGNLWMGGCIDGVRLPDDFERVVSLYKWEEYVLGEHTQRLTVEMYDSADEPRRGQVEDLASLAWMWSRSRKTLVHCQAGLNRSGLVVARALMKGGYSARQAIDLLRTKRHRLVLCNRTFENWLLAIEREGS